MNRLWNTGLAAGLVCCSAAAFAQYHTVYFNQQGKITATMSSVAYVRQYQVDAGMAQVQDFYYPSMKKYSDPYQVSAAQIKDFVPVLGNVTGFLVGAAAGAVGYWLGSRGGEAAYQAAAQ